MAASAVAYLWLRDAGQGGVPAYRTTPLARGDLVVSVAATGNLQPTNQVEVGSELSGIVETVAVDVNDRVVRGQILARLDVSRLRDQLADARGALAAARAQVAESAATAREQRLALDRLQRMAAISKGTVPSKADMDAADAAWQRARAGEAMARAAVQRAMAAVGTAETNMAKASIRSPIDGVVLTREIEPGQTVAASLQAPVLFTLAEDLTRMELQVDVDEADVGAVRDGQEATFTVDAWPERIYPAHVRRVGYGSQTKDGVVSYPTVLTVDNADLSLRPGMTASASIVTARRHDIWLVPNAALRFAPAETATSVRRSGGLMGSLVPRHPRTSSQDQPDVRSRAGTSRQIWILRDGRPQALTVRVGASDGRDTEVAGDGLEQGMAVITDTAAQMP